MNLNNYIIVADITNFGTNAKDAILPQISSIAIIAVAVGILMFVIKKSLMKAIGTAIAGGAITYLINNPDKLITWGGQIIKTIFG